MRPTQKPRPETLNSRADTSSVRDLIKELIPHAPQVGLFVAPDIPSDKLDNAVQDFAKEVLREDVVALYDATLMGSAKDGAVFTTSRLVFQNNDLEPTHTVSYVDMVGVDSRRKLIGGRKVVVTVNRGRATFKLEMDFSGKPDAAEYVTRFLKEAMLRGDEEIGSGRRGEPQGASSAGESAERRSMDASETNPAAVRAALYELHEKGALSAPDLESMLRVLEEST